MTAGRRCCCTRCWAGASPSSHWKRSRSPWHLDFRLNASSLTAGIKSSDRGYYRVFQYPVRLTTRAYLSPRDWSKDRIISLIFFLRSDVSFDLSLCSTPLRVPRYFLNDECSLHCSSIDYSFFIFHFFLISITSEDIVTSKCVVVHLGTQLCFLHH